ncbi:senescence-associated protein-domain-containing protein [Microdochium trichocladiopsis]|uniref:Senescence-associated protein-domain-containing protein n=1 Tax=Microdochium trichocladiopsis TaxID=1682393 RepID=A0A9P8Y7V0_9PEZI|nr:senescence-associated protein-domain-containing protein [Microdochium trichocladiopsis]KAH7031313.1 senescence-associated protein-domain-containing protein [Microdochium trichocladiopsis]
MAAGHNDPKLLYAIRGVSAYHLAYGKEESLTPAGPQTLSLLMVPTSSPFADPSSLDASQRDAEEDFYLHLHLPPELDLPLPATTQIYHQPPCSYLIPRWDLGRDSGAFTRLEFPQVGSRKGLQEDVDTFETILAQCTAFLERAAPPKTAKAKEAAEDSFGQPSTSSSSKSKMAYEDQLPAYDPGQYEPGEAYVQGSRSSHQGGRIVLIDEEDGSVIGELGEGYEILDAKVEPGSKAPVEITMPADGEAKKLAIVPASQETLEEELHPAYKKSTLVTKATAVSRLIMTTTNIASTAMASGSDAFIRNTKPLETAMTFQPTTHERVRRIGKFSGDVAGVSAKTVGQVTKVAQNLGAHLSGRGKGKDPNARRGYGPDGKPLDSFKPSLLNKSMMAFSTVADGIDQAARNLMTSATTNATTMVTHRWGDEAGEMSKHLGGSVKNVGLVYIDVTGVSRRAIIKAVGKGMVVGKVKGGGEIVVGDDITRQISNAGSSGQSPLLLEDSKTASLTGEKNSY